MDATLVQAVVNRLNETRFPAKMGSHRGVPYPSLRVGAWTIALHWDSGVGHWCSNAMLIGEPHWDWYCTTNMNLWGVEYAFGSLVLPEEVATDPEVLALAMLLISDDPCHIPNAFGTPGFSCPRCTQSWSTSQNRDMHWSGQQVEVSTPIGFSELSATAGTSRVKETPGSQAPEAWAEDPDLLEDLFNAFPEIWRS